jgi:hypothetical protein
MEDQDSKKLTYAPKPGFGLHATKNSSSTLPDEDNNVDMDNSTEHRNIGFFHYGDTDLFGSHGRTVIGGGTQVGPNHPGFHPTSGGHDTKYNPYSPFSGGIGAPDFVPPPRGAKFDPYGPPPNSNILPDSFPHFPKQ